MWRFVPLAYGLDLRVLDQVVKLPQPRLLRDSGGRDDDGEVQGRPARYLPVPSGTPHLRLRAPHSFPDQGRLAVGRIPVGTTIFFAAWLVGWTVGGLTFATTESSILGISFALFGWLFGLRRQRSRWST